MCDTLLHWGNRGVERVFSQTGISNNVSMKFYFDLVDQTTGATQMTSDRDKTATTPHRSRGLTGIYARVSDSPDFQQNAV